MLTRKYLKTIIVNLGVNYCQFKGCILFGLEEYAWRISNPKQKNLAKSECKVTAKIYFFQILHAPIGGIVHRVGFLHDSLRR